MINQLSINNIALIDNLEINFGSGLNIMTGETGAGKSIIIDAVNLVLGERADKELIQTGKETARVEILFTIENCERVNSLLAEYGIAPEEDNSLLFMRELTVNGKNICKVNGRTVTLSMLKELSRLLVDIHGQHQHQSLLHPEMHLRLLDKLGGQKYEKIKESLSEKYNAWRSIRSRIRKLSGLTENGERRIDLLKYQINEIEGANLQNDEEEALKQERMLLQNAEKITGIVNEAYEQLYAGTRGGQSVSDTIGNISVKLSQIQSCNNDLDSIACALEDLNYRLEDVVSSLRVFKDNLDFEPGRLDVIEARIDLINSLKRKYGKTIEEILALKADMEQELYELENSQASIDELNKQSESTFKELINLCTTFSEMRESCAARLEREITKQLADLNMDKTQFKVSIRHPSPEQLSHDADNQSISSNGIDDVEFLISPNPGEPLKPLSKIISGGEMSRVMLAFKTVLGEADDIPTLIFDEIDVGISGRTADIVGDKMRSLSKNHQVICVTHLPQIAAKAESHYLISKNIVEGKTKTSVWKLSLSEREHEVARMIGGAELTKLSIEHAKELMSRNA